MSVAKSRTMSRDHKSMESPMCHSGASTRRATLLAAVSIAAACSGQAPLVPLTPDLLRAVEPGRPAAQKGQTATLLPTGQWLLVGGEDAGRPTAAAMLLDATTSQPVPNRLAHPRALGPHGDRSARRHGVGPRRMER